jgi:hypothetical protein
MKRAKIFKLAQCFDAGITDGGSSQFRLNYKWRKPLEFCELRIIEATGDVSCAKDKAIRCSR